jgi:hypothetical protein
MSLSVRSLTIGLALAAAITPAAQALPGQYTEEVQAWMQAHPTLQPGVGEKLMVRKSDSAAQRFTFQASVLPPGRVTPVSNKGVIRSEMLTLFDMTNGVTANRLEESLRVIYGLDIFQDYDRGKVAYTYPGYGNLNVATNRRLPLQAARQGEVRIGDRYAYWVEVTRTKTGKAYGGQVVVFQKEDLDKVEAELRNR